MKKKNFQANDHSFLDVDEDIESELSLFDPTNPDINLFNLVDDEIIRLAGSKLLYYKYHQVDQDFDAVYMEQRNKPISSDPVIVYGHYEPRALEENLTQFGIELQNDQVFVFNKDYIERRLSRRPHPGDVVMPKFQNQKYEIFEVQEDSFEAYGVFHLTCSAKLLRDTEAIQDQPLLKVSTERGGPVYEE
tara:strand:+ start:137 stop:706 length:570 start_codon:yes stop_codon:yes gene_type:complete